MPLVEDVYSRTASEAELSHLFDYLLDFACDERILGLYKKWEAQTGIKCDSWQTKYMVTKWGACSTDKKKLWFNLQLAQKPYACIDYIILHELTHLITRKHDAAFIAHMDRYMPNWREIRKELNDSRLDYYEAQDESPLQKLFDQSRYDDIRDAAIAFIREEQSSDGRNRRSLMWNRKRYSNLAAGRRSNCI